MRPTVISFVLFHMSKDAKQNQKPTSFKKRSSTFVFEILLGTEAGFLDCRL